MYAAYVVSVCVVASYHCIILYCIAFVDVAACWPRLYQYSIVRCPRRGTMQLHTLFVMEAVDMHMHCIYTLRFTCIKAVDMRSFPFEEVVYFLNITMLLLLYAADIAYIIWLWIINFLYYHIFHIWINA
jgi:hypothetical protein